MKDDAKGSSVPPSDRGGSQEPAENESARGAGRRPGGNEASSIPEPLRRLLEAGLGRLGDTPEAIRQRLAELRLPREAWSAILAQLDDRKSGLYRLIAKEVRDLLENTNFAEELVRALTTLSFEMKTEVRFIPNDAGGARPNVRSNLKVKTRKDDEEPRHAGDAGERATQSKPTPPPSNREPSPADNREAVAETDTPAK